MRSNRVRALIVAIAASALALVTVSSAVGLSDMTSTPRAIAAADGSLTLSVVSGAGNNAAIHGNYNYWTSPIDPSGNFEWFNKPVQITDFSFPDVGNGAPMFQTATFARNIGTGYSAPADLADPFGLSDDGVYSIVATGTDSVLGDVRGEITPAFGIDQTKPVVTANVAPFYSGAQSITVSATDTVSGIENVVFDVNGTHDVSWEPSQLDPANFSADFPFLGEGIHTFSWAAFDNAGNVTKGAATFTIDMTAPKTISDRVPVYNGPATIKLTATDVSGSGVAHTYYILDSNAQVEGTTVSVPAPATGAASHTLEFWSVDALGNVETPHVTTTFTVNALSTITVGAHVNGAITPGTANYIPGANATFAITADAGYHTVAVLVDGVSVGAVPTYTFTNITLDHTISATFAVDTTPTTTSDRVAVYNGPATIKLTATDVGGPGVAHTYYRLDGNAQVEGTTISVPAPTTGAAPHVLEFWSVDVAGNVETPHVTTSFTVNALSTITVGAHVNGAITPGTSNYILGANATYTIIANAGYHTVSVLVDGVSVGAVPTYMFTNITLDHTISATFAANALNASTSTIRATATSIRYGQTVRLFGVVSPNASGGLVTIQRRINTGSWANLTTASINSSSAYTRTISKMSKGAWQFRARYAGTSSVAVSYSMPLRVIVR